VQQVQEVPADGVVIGLQFDAAAVVAPVIPVEEDRTEARHQAIGNVPRTHHVVIVLLGKYRTQCRTTGPHDVHGVGGSRNPLQDRLDVGGQSAQSLQLALVRRQLGLGRQFAVDQQVGDFLEIASLRDVQDVVTAVMKVIAGAAHGTEGGIAGGHAGQGNGFLGFGRCRCFAHLFSLANN